MTSDALNPAAAPTPEPKTSFFQRVGGVLFAPVDTFDDVARRPDILWPMLFFVIISYITTAVILPRFDFESMIAQQSEVVKKQNPNASDDDIERIAKITRASTTVMAWVGPLLQLAFFAVVAGVLLLAFRMFGGAGTFKQAFSVTLYSWIPRLIQGIVMTIVALARGSIDPMSMATVVKSNPAFLVDMKEQPVLFSLLSSLDLFAIWSLVLLIIGFAAVAKVPRVRAAVVVVSLWAVTIAIKLGFAALGASRMNG